MAVKSTKSRAGGEKRGNKYDRARRRSNMSIAHPGGKIVTRRDVVATTVKAFEKLAADEKFFGVAEDERTILIEAKSTGRAIVSQMLRYRLGNYCAHCEALVSLLPEHKPDDAAGKHFWGLRAEVDKIDPDGGYTAENTQVLCHDCNHAKSDKFIG